jgi:hypothetical protein
MKRLGLLALIAGCSGETGTIQLGVTTAPGSALLDGVEVLRVTLTEPPTVVEAPRTANGFDLVMDVEATGIGAALIIEGFDGAGSLLATGMSPQFAVSALDARIVIYLAAPMTIAPSPAPLPAARIGVASTPLTYGFALAGGEDVAGTRTDSIFIYNTFDHSLLAGSTMPAVRSFQTLATGNNNNVYLFGGLGSDGAPTGSLWRFDTNVQPAGAYSLSPDQVDLARDHASAITLETERILITGTPPIDLTFGTPTARTDIPALTTGTSVIVDNRPLAVFSGDPLLRLRDGVFEELAYGSEPGASLAAVGEFVVVPSFRGTTEFAVVTPANLDNPGMFLDRQTSVRRQAAIAATSRHLVIAGGLDELGAPVPTADIFDVTDFSLIATVPCFARAGATAIALPNDQIAIVGGEPANDLIELFTPSAPTR